MILCIQNGYPPLEEPVSHFQMHQYVFQNGLELLFLQLSAFLLSSHAKRAGRSASQGKKECNSNRSLRCLARKMPLGSYAADLGIGDGMKKRRASSM